MFPVLQLDFCVSGDSDNETELPKLYIPKGLLDEIIRQIRLRKTRMGIPQMPGYYKINNKYKCDLQRFKGYQGRNFDVEILDIIHRSTSELTAWAIQREYEKERRRQIQQKQILGRPNDDFRRKILEELKQCFLISQEEEIKNEEIKKLEVEMMKDRIHEELLWFKHEKELKKELEVAKGMFFQLLDVRRMSTKMLGKLATFHQQKQKLHQVIKQAAGDLCVDEQKKMKLIKEQIHDLKFQLHNELRRREIFKRLPELEATEVQWRVTVLRLSKEDLVRQKTLTQQEAVHTQLLSFFQRFREMEDAKNKKAFKQHQERLENVLIELLDKYWRKQHTKEFAEEKVRRMQGSNQEDFENFWNPVLHELVNTGFRFSKKIEETQDHKEKETEMLSLQKNERQVKIEQPEKKDKQQLLLKRKKSPTPIESSKISDAKERRNKPHCYNCHKAIILCCDSQKKFEQKSVQPDLSKKKKKSEEQTFLSKNDKVVEYTSGSPSEEISIKHWICSHDHEKKCYCNLSMKHIVINHNTQKPKYLHL